MKNMFVDSTLSAMSTWITYFAQIALGYLITLGICALIQNPRTRFRLWGCFLFLTVIGWTVFCLPGPAGSFVAATTSALPFTGNRGLWEGLPVSGSWAAQLAWLGPWTWRFYLSIFTICIVQLGWRSLRLRNFLRSGEPPSAEVDLLFQSVCQEMKVSRCDLILLPGLRSPATACWRRPRVLLPTELVPFLDTSQLADVLRHELTHVRGRHYLWDRLAAVGCRVVFFHPAVWLAHRRLRRERELACDLAVVQASADRRLPYAECLVKLVRWCFLARKNSPDAIGFSSSESMLTTRVRAVLRETNRSSGLQQAARGGLVAAVATTALCVLPSIGITLYRFVPRNATIARSDLHDASSHRHVAGIPNESKMRPPKAPAPPSAQLSSTRTEVAALFEHLNSPALPVLGNPSTVASGSPQATPPPSGNGQDTAPASHPVWDEAPASGTSISAPDWQRATIDAIRVGVAVGTGTGEGESRDGQVGQQGNH